VEWGWGLGGSYACVCADRTRVLGREATPVDGILYYGITYYGGGEASIMVACVGQADASAAEEPLISREKLADPEGDGIGEKTHFSCT